MIQHKLKEKRFILKTGMKISVARYLLKTGKMDSGKIEYVAWYTRERGVAPKYFPEEHKTHTGYQGSVNGKSLREVMGRLRMAIARELNPSIGKVTSKLLASNKQKQFEKAMRLGTQYGMGGQKLSEVLENGLFKRP